MRYICIAGGVVSGLGKGITISSIGRILKESGLRVTAIKIDPYLNVDAGTMSPFEHGEVFVLDDGGEGDLDLGNYERFLNIKLTSEHNITTGKVYKSVIEKERRGDYLGKTVQVVPHITSEIQERIERVAKIPVDGSGESADVCLIEVGGTVGDIESAVFLEALRQFTIRVGPQNFILFFLSFIPVLGAVGEQKTKPTQHGVQNVRAVGLSPDVIVCRCDSLVEKATKEKISVFCNVLPSHVLSVHNVSNIYHVPLILVEQGLHTLLRSKLQLGDKMRETPDFTEWSAMARAFDTNSKKVKIALVGKYTNLKDSYLSVYKSLIHAALAVGVELEVTWIEATNLEEETAKKDKTKYDNEWSLLRSVEGIVVPGGFGTRGVDGKILTVNYARENKIPILGICLGFQVMVIEFARAKLGMEDCTSEEIAQEKEKAKQASGDERDKMNTDEDLYPKEKKVKKSPHAIVFMPEIDPKTMGGTLRCGSRPCLLTESFQTREGPRKSMSPFLYKKKFTYPNVVMERHRHRYEVNPEIVKNMEEQGLYFVGRDDTKTRMEILELPRDVHPYYVGCQFHPEFNSRPLDPSPLFYGLLLAATGQLDEFLLEADIGK